MPSTTVTQRIAFVAVPGFQFMSVAALAAFEFAGKIAGENLYEVNVLSETGGAVRSSLGMTIDTKPFDHESYDTVIVGGGNTVVPTSPALIAFLQRSAKSSRRLAAICMGAFALADAGILDGRRATTHWASARKMQAQYPGIQMDEDKIFIIDGQVWTSAGATAGIDLALGMVEKDLGADVARSVARMLVVSHRRAGGQSQHSALLEMDAKSDRIQNALTYARQNLRAPLSVEELAKAANLSPRQFSRAFRAETGQPPAKAVENLRVEAARLMMEQSRHPIDVIARETGFADRERMRRAFLRAFGQPPQAIRRSARNDAVA
jgi:transcriptional regulator GlxA family with amidase domain